MTQVTVGESCKGLHNALTSAIARRLPLGHRRAGVIVQIDLIAIAVGTTPVMVCRLAPDGQAWYRAA